MPHSPGTMVPERQLLLRKVCLQLKEDKLFRSQQPCEPCNYCQGTEPVDLQNADQKPNLHFRQDSSQAGAHGAAQVAALKTKTGNRKCCHSEAAT